MVYRSALMALALILLPHSAGCQCVPQRPFCNGASCQVPQPARAPFQGPVAFPAQPALPQPTLAADKYPALGALQQRLADLEQAHLGLVKRFENMDGQLGQHFNFIEQNALPDLVKRVSAAESTAQAAPGPDRVKEVAAKVALDIVNNRADAITPLATTSLTAVLTSLGIAGGPAGIAAVLALWLAKRAARDIAAKAVARATAGKPATAPQPPSQPFFPNSPDAADQSDGPQLRIFPPADGTGQTDSPAPTSPVATQAAQAPSPGADAGGSAAAKLPSLPVDYAKIWADHAKANGLNVAHEALRLQIYKEAMEHLRKGDLPLPAHVDGPTIADAIDHWVLNEFFRRGSDKVPEDNIYQNALMGFLYRDAVDRLRGGEFGVQGAFAAADAIDDWVKREFLKRVGSPPSS